MAHVLGILKALNILLMYLLWVELFPPNSYIEALTPSIPKNISLFRNRVDADIIS